MDWTEKHRPRSLKEVVGNGPTVARLRAWAEAWRTGMPERRAVVLAGVPGTGKTSTALALAHDMGWTAIELNASDARNAATIQRVATAGAVHQTFSASGEYQAAGAGGGSGPGSGRKLIILDEADNLYERGDGAAGADGESLSDRGGKAAIIDTIRQARQPIILIVNDLYALEKGSGSALKQLTEVLKFQRVNVRSIPPALARIAHEEGVQVDREVLEAIAARSEGDLRAAVRDLESISVGRTRVTMEEARSLGSRDTQGNLFDLVRHILKGRRMEDIRAETFSVDATPEDLVLWVDENLPREYRHPEDLVAGYETLARADIFLGRTRRTQDYTMWGYASELTTVGVMSARRHEYKEFVPFGFPQWLSRMGRTKGLRQTKDELALHLGRLTHISKRKARTEQVEPVAMLFRADREFAIHMTHLMGLQDEEVVLLLGPDANARAVKEIRAAADALAPQVGPPRRPEPGLEELARKPAPAGGEEAAQDDGEGEGEGAARPARPKPAAGQKGLFGF